jgi:hypothetical protein
VPLQFANSDLFLQASTATALGSAGRWRLNRFAAAAAIGSNFRTHTDGTVRGGNGPTLLQTSA